jgi:hypothetical protein
MSITTSLPKRAAKLDREANARAHGLGPLAVHVEDGDLSMLGDVGRVLARTALLGRGREADLVVDDHVDACRPSR